MEQLHALFNLSMEDLFGHHPHRVTFDRRCLRMDNGEDYYHYIVAFSNRMQALSKAEGFVFINADEVPIFHFMPYKRLIYFKLYCFAFDQHRFDLKYEDFVQQMERDDLDTVFEQIFACYNEIPSIEIWDDQVLDMMLFDIEHYEVMARFVNPETKREILTDLMALVDDVMKITSDNEKPSGARFDLYRRPFPNRLGAMLMKESGKDAVAIKLGTINSMITTDPGLVREISIMLDTSRSKSTALSRGAERERMIFFRGLREKIERTMNGE